MAVSNICPETGKICEARQWLAGIEGLIVTERLASDDTLSGSSFGQKLLHAWDVLGGHKSDRNRGLQNDVNMLSGSLGKHEDGAKAGEKRCIGTLCGSMAILVTDLYGQE